MKKLLLPSQLGLWVLLTYLLNSFSLPAATYYVAANGSDSYSASQAQSAATPWQTIAKLNSVTFNSGDVVLFRRGDTFRGQVTAISGVTYGAYGTGNLPVISGATVVSGWSLYQGNIYVANVSATVKNVFVNHRQMTLARYPNSGFLYTDTNNGKSGFIDADLTQPDGYWNGANVKICEYEWIYEWRPVQSHSGSTVTFSSDLIYAPEGERAYYLDNKLSMLDAEREWYYDTAAKKLYLYAPGGVNPSALLVETSVYDAGFKGDLNRQNITIQNLQMEKQGVDGVQLLGAQAAGNTITNTVVTKQGEVGLHVEGNNIRIENNTLTDINGAGVQGQALTNASISRNTIKRINLVTAYGINGHNNGTGILLDGTGDKNWIAYNQIDSTGYSGIRPDGTNHTVEKNIIRYPLVTLADGAGIYFWGDYCHHTTIRNNFISNPQGIGNGQPGSIAFGIYLDNYVHDNQVYNNTVANSRYGGIFINAGAYNNTIRNNVVYGSGVHQLRLQDYLPDNATADNRVARNVLYGLDPKAISLLLNSKFDRFDMGTLDSNYHCNPYADVLIQRTNATEVPAYTFSQWQSLFGQDPKGKKSAYRWDVCTGAPTSTNNLVTNGNFDSDVSGWTCWNGEVCNVAHSTAGGLDGGALKFTMTSNTGYQSAFAISPQLSLTAGQWYELSFSIKSSKAGAVNVRITQNHSPYEGLFYRVFNFDASRKDHRYVFQMPVTDSQARLDFEIDYQDREFWLDNVKLVPVTATCHDAQARSPLFTNPSDNSRTVTLSGPHRDLDGNVVSGSFTLAPWSSRVLVAEPGSGASLANGLYKLTSKVSVGGTPLRVLDVSGSVDANNRNVQIYQDNSSAAQQWYIQSTGDGFYKIISQVGSKTRLLDATNGRVDGGNVTIYAPNATDGGSNQRWKIEPTGNSYYTLTTKTSASEATKYLLDVYNGVNANGGSSTSDAKIGNVQIYHQLLVNGQIADRQLWRIEPASSSARQAAGAVVVSESNDVQLWPNPATEAVMLILQARQAQTVQVQLRDLQGRSVWQQSQSVAGGTVQVQLSLPPLPKGLYLIYTILDGKHYVNKVMIQ